MSAGTTSELHRARNVDRSCVELPEDRLVSFLQDRLATEIENGVGGIAADEVVLGDRNSEIIPQPPLDFIHRNPRSGRDSWRPDEVALDVTAAPLTKDETENLRHPRVLQARPDACNGSIIAVHEAEADNVWDFLAQRAEDVRPLLVRRRRSPLNPNVGPCDAELLGEDPE